VLALDRLVSVSDYAAVARTFGGVGKATASRLGHDVHVTIAGAADAPVDATSDLYRNLSTVLQAGGDPTLGIVLDIRETVALTLSAHVGMDADHAWDDVAPRVRAALLDAFGFERRALAQDAYASQVIGCIQAVPGVAWVAIDAFGSIDEATVLAGFDGGNALPVSTADRVRALPARLDADGRPRPAQLAYFLAAVPDTLLLQEATP
jgi:hypothetical protein